MNPAHRPRLQALLWAFVAVGILATGAFLAAAFLGSVLLPMALWDAGPSTYRAVTMRLYAPAATAGLVTLGLTGWARWRSSRQPLAVVSGLVVAASLAAVAAGVSLEAGLLRAGYMGFSSAVKFAAVALGPGLIGVVLGALLAYWARSRRLGTQQDQLPERSVKS